MVRPLNWLGASLLALQIGGADPALAGDRSAAPTALVFVDPAGRVLPARAKPTPGPFCPEAVALPTDTAKALVERIATEEDFYPEFVSSVAKIESGYVSTALSERGAYGLMQLMPDTARRFGVDRCDPAANVRGGIRFLRSLHGRYRNPFFILAAYNAGEETVQRARGVPANPETVRFVADVMNDFYTWPNMAGAKSRTPTSASPDLVEVAPSRPRRQGPGPFESGPEAQPARGDSSLTAARWDGGFVLHID